MGVVPRIQTTPFVPQGVPHRVYGSPGVGLTIFPPVDRVRRENLTRSSLIDSPATYVGSFLRGQRAKRVSPAWSGANAGSATRFRDKELLRAALTHASGAQHRLASNERLEFLGDAILGAVVCEMLFHQYPEYLEGDLTKIKSIVVSRQTCAKISEALGLEEFLILGKGMTTHPSVPPSLLSDVFESLMAAIYLDGGDAPVARVHRKIHRPGNRTGRQRRAGRQLQIAAAAIGPARIRHHAHLPVARRKRPRPQQVLQDLRPGRPPLPARLGPQQERSRAARRPQRPERAGRQADSVSDRLNTPPEKNPEHKI